MHTFNPFRQDVTSSELISFMRQNFPMVVFDQQIPMTELQTLIKKWIDLGQYSTSSPHLTNLLIIIAYVSAFSS